VWVSGFKDGLATDELGVASFEVTPLMDEFSLTIEANDQEGRLARQEVRLRSAQAGEDFLLRTDRAVYEGGSRLHLTVLGSSEGQVYVDLLRDGMTLMTEAVRPKAGRGECSFDLPAEVFGTLELRAYRYGTSPMPVTRTRAIHVRPARLLDIRADLDRKEYRPGGIARLDLQVRDRGGKPAPGALSLAAVDEAVFSVLAQAPQREETYFTSDARLLRPIHALYPWSAAATLPVAPEQRQRFEQALFASTATKGIAEREARLRTLLPSAKDQRRLSDVMDIPDWEDRIEEARLPREAIQILSSGKHVYPLQLSTFSKKLRETEVQREDRLSWMPTVWITYLCIIGTGLWAWLLSVLKRPIEIGCILLPCVLFVLIGILIPRKVYDPLATPKKGYAETRYGYVRRAFRAVLTNENYAAKFADIDPTLRPERQVPRVRQWFPETLLWRPELITDDQGRAHLDIPLADSITTWRLNASAVTADGRLGSAVHSLRVFQPFFVELNLPVALTRGDEIAVPAVVYNYLPKPQAVTLTLADAPWFERQDEATRTLELAANEVRSVAFRLRARRVGRHQLEVTAQAGAVADAVRRSVDVVPEGRATEMVTNGDLRGPAYIDLAVPADAIEGSVQALVRLYPSRFSQLLEGLDGILQLPHGCFEQTSSTTYPNILALDYLRRAGRSAPELESKARRYLVLGYQRLLSFEVAGGGFDWFGRAPANRALTAYGLMEFVDMARVHEVDPALIERTRRWLLDQCRPDGSWDPESHQLQGNPARASGEQARLGTTAYIAWAVFAGSQDWERSRTTLTYLRRHEPSSIHDPYTLALVCNALLAIDPPGSAARPYLERLEALKRSTPDGKHVWWEQEQAGRTLFHGAGRSGSVETTGLASLALLAGRRDPPAIRGALAWLAEQRDGRGTWHSTQATVLALKALLAGTGRPLGGDRERRLEITLDGQVVERRTIPADQAEVMQHVNLSPKVGPGTHRLRLTDRSDAATAFQVVFRYHRPEGKGDDTKGLSLQLAYDRTELKVGESVTATATLANGQAQAAPMVMLEVPIPPGFVLETADLEKLVSSQVLARFEPAPQKALLYLRSLEPGKPPTLRYRLRATLAGRVTAPAAVAYEYYNPDKRAQGEAVQLRVSAD
jgi:hypothetical protein